MNSAHQQFISALDNIWPVIESTWDGSICGGSSALSYIGSSSEAAQVRTTAKALAAADAAHPYTIVDFVPPATPNANRQLGSGTVVKKNTSGANVLKVENKQSTDVVVSLAPANSTAAVLMMYVRAGQTGTAKGIHDGSYNVFVTSGSDWDTGARSFTRDCEYRRFTDTIDLTSTSRQYTVETLTLGAGSDGNAFVTPSDSGSFPT